MSVCIKSIGVKDVKKEGKINITTFIFFNTIYLITLKVYSKFKDPAEKSVTEIFVGEQEK